MGLLSNDELIHGGPPAPIFDGAAQVLRQLFGVDIQQQHGWFSTMQVCEQAEEGLLLGFLAAAWGHIARLDSSMGGRATPVSPDTFRDALNSILESARHPKRLLDGRIVDAVSSEAAALRRVLLAGAEEAAGCVQGDVQVEMVVSTIQAALAKPGAVLVDYGVGLGRVLAGLSTATLFPNVEYIGVEEPIAPAVKKLARQLGAKTRLMSRSDFFSSKVTADVIMVVNTLHHIPFRDMGRQLSGLLKRLSPGGHLLVHDMGELREPEQRNVPWPLEDILVLFSAPSLRTNARSTASRKKHVPISNVLIEVTQADNIETALEANVRAAWEHKKRRVLEDLAALYAARDPSREVELQHALIINANLDLNRPGP